MLWIKQLNGRHRSAGSWNRVCWRLLGAGRQGNRRGRNTGDVNQPLEWLDKHKVNVKVRNIGLESRTAGKKNPVWKMITSVMSSLYEMEIENIKERTHNGRMMYLRNGGKVGRPGGSTEIARYEFSGLKWYQQPYSLQSHRTS